MKGDILTQLQRISNQLDCIGRDMREEERVYAAELEDRLQRVSLAMLQYSITMSGWIKQECHT